MMRAPRWLMATPLLLAGCGLSLPGSIDKTSPQPEAAPADANLSRYISPLVGTFPPGFVNPGPFSPFGMVQVGPDSEGPINYGGYSFQNLLINGFSHVHMSAGVFKAGQIPFMPMTGPVTPGNLGDIGYPSQLPAYSSAFEHVTEKAEAGYYSVNLLRYGVQAELTSTERAGFHRYTYLLPGLPPEVLIHVGRDHSAADHMGTATMQPDGVLTGSVQTGDNYTVYFAARFNAAYTAATLDGEALAEGVEVQGEGLGVLLTFAGLDGPLLSKVGISYVDAAGALRNLDAEIPGWDFDAVVAQHKQQWNEALGRIEVEGGTEAQRQSFYTALARTQQFPNLISDVDGRYPGPDDQIHQSERPHYTQFSLWDSYRGQNQVLAEIVPEQYRDMLNSLLDFYRQSGRLPRWQQAQRDASHMSGDPAILFIGDGWCRGLSESATKDELYRSMQSLTEVRAKEIELGYIPTPPATIFEQIQGGARFAGTTLEYGLADFALAMMAQSDARSADAQSLAQRSLNYRNLTNPDEGQTQGFIRPRAEDGSWLTPFMPELPYGFQEGTSWQYSWLVMHDYAGLIERMGGADTVKQHLNTFFGFPVNLIPFVLPTIQNQITVFGTAYYGNQFAPGNEHDLEAPYVYNYLGAPWQTQAAVRALTSIYAPTPLGLPGNDDLGALSGALVWNMMGVYPMNPGSPLMVIGSPHFTKVTMHRPSGDFVVNAPGASAIAQFVDGARLDGSDLPRTWFLLPRGATELQLDATAMPDLNWGASSDAFPPSLTTAPLEAFGCQR